MKEREWYDKVLERRVTILEGQREWLEILMADVERVKARIKEQEAAVEEWRAGMRELFGDA